LSYCFLCKEKKITGLYYRKIDKFLRYYNYEISLLYIKNTLDKKDIEYMPPSDDDLAKMIAERI
jgi:hypothetical protein